MLRDLSDRIAADPGNAVYGVCPELAGGLAGPMLTVRHGDLQAHLPVIGGWPLRRLSPEGVAATLAEVADACLGDEDHETAMLPYATAALAAAIAEGTLPDTAVSPDGLYTVEVCMDGEADRLALYVGDGPEQVRIPSPHGPAVAPARVPCAVHEISSDTSDVTSIAMTYACTESEGVVCENVRTDPMEILRTGAARSRRHPDEVAG